MDILLGDCPDYDPIAEAMIFQQEDRIIQEFESAIGTLTTAHDLLVKFPDSVEVNDIALSMISPFSEDIGFDLESAKEDFKLTRFVLKLVGNLIKKITRSFIDYLDKFFSTLRVRAGQAKNLVIELNSSLHNYKDAVPMIKPSKGMAPIIDGKNPMSPVEFSAMTENINKRFAADQVQAVINANIKMTIARLPDMDKPLTSMAEMEEAAWKDIVATRSFDLIEKNNVIEARSTFGNIPVSLLVSKKTGSLTAPKAGIEITPVKLRKEITGYTPKDALLVASQVHQMLSRTLEKDNGSVGMRELKGLLKAVDKSIFTAEQNQALKMIPGWIKFIRDYIKASLDYEYIAGTAGLLVAKQSMKQWETI